MYYDFTNPSKSKPRVLIVENDPKARVDYQTLLMYWDYEPVLAMGTGGSLIEDAKRKAEEYRCALALIDLRLTDDYNDKDTSGLKLAEQMPEAIRPIILSGHADPEILIALLQKRVDIIFIKKDTDRDSFQGLVDTEAAKVTASKRGLVFENPEILMGIASSPLGEQAGNYPDQIADIFARLFPKAKRLRLEKLEIRPASSIISTIPRPNSAVIKVYEDSYEPVVVKLARAEKIRIEADRYNTHIHMRLTGGFTARMERSTALWDIGGASYSFVDKFDVKPFSSFYEENPIPAITECLSSFFEGVWKKHYDNAKVATNVSLFQLYSQVWGDWYGKKVKETTSKINSPTASQLDIPEPICWIGEKIAEADRDLSMMDATRLAITHGDLHGDNLLVDNKRNVWVIDFERCGEGHALQDFIELESDIYNRLEEHHYNNIAFLRMYLAILKEKQIASLMVDASITDDVRLNKAIATVAFLRSLAVKLTNITDAREYLLGLLFNAVFRAALVQKIDSQKSRRSLLLAGLICHRLDHWDEPWPPENWNLL